MFQNDPPTTVFLLSIRAGAVGINLTQANFIVLLDACTNPALEAQAIGRVRRLGQKRKVHIRRYIMKDSIETRILEMEAEKNRKNVVEEEDEDDDEEETKKNDDSTTNSTTTTTTTTTTSTSSKKKKGKGTRNDPISIGFADTAVAGSIMSSTQRFRVNEFIKLFGVKDSELPDMYKRGDESGDDKKNKKKKKKTKSKKRKTPSPSTSQSKKARRDEEEEACVIS
jgi:superfamily II DNA or RNA helicase